MGRPTPGATGLLAMLTLGGCATFEPWFAVGGAPDDEYTRLCEQLYEAILLPGGSSELRSVILGDSVFRLGTGKAGPSYESASDWYLVDGSDGMPVHRDRLEPILVRMRLAGVGVLRATIDSWSDNRESACAYHGCVFSEFTGCAIAQAPRHFDAAWMNGGWERASEVLVSWPQSIPNSCRQGQCEWRSLGR